MGEATPPPHTHTHTPPPPPGGNTCPRTASQKRREKAKLVPGSDVPPSMNTGGRHSTVTWPLSPTQPPRPVPSVSRSAAPMRPSAAAFRSPSSVISTSQPDPAPLQPATRANKRLQVDDDRVSFLIASMYIIDNIIDNIHRNHHHIMGIVGTGRYGTAVHPTYQALTVSASRTASNGVMSVSERKENNEKASPPSQSRSHANASVSCTACTDLPGSGRAVPGGPAASAACGGWGLRAGRARAGAGAFTPFSYSRDARRNSCRRWRRGRGGGRRDPPQRPGCAWGSGTWAAPSSSCRRRGHPGLRRLRGSAFQPVGHPVQFHTRVKRWSKMLLVPVVAHLSTFLWCA